MCQLGGSLKIESHISKQRKRDTLNPTHTLQDFRPGLHCETELQEGPFVGLEEKGRLGVALCLHGILKVAAATSQ